MGLFSDSKPYTAISTSIDRLTSRSDSSEDAGDIMELLEEVSIDFGAGSAEAGRALRKKIKHGTTREQVRALYVTEMLIDNGGERMSGMLSPSGLGDQIVLSTKSTDPKVKKAARILLSNWATRDNSRLRSWAEQAGLRSRASSSARPPRQASPEPVRSPHRGRPSRRYEEEEVSRPRQRSPSRSPSPINIRGASIVTTIATGHTIATRLSESVITHTSDVTASRECKGYFHQAKSMRKRVLNLIHSEKPEIQEYLDQLLALNEELVASLQAFEGAAKGYYEDSGDDDWEEPAPPPQPARPAPSASSNAPASRRSPSPAAPPASSRYDREPRTPESLEDPADPFADANESKDAPVHTPLW